MDDVRDQKPKGRAKLDKSDGNKRSNVQFKAVVVAINDYPGEANDLPSCVNDAREFEELLSDNYGFDSVVSLIDNQATITNVTKAIEHAFQGAGPDSRIVFFYSGHGSTEKRGSVMDECLVLYDGYYFDDDLVTLSQSAPAGVLTVVLDSCFSGGMEKKLLALSVSEGKVLERAKVKAYTRSNLKDFFEHSQEQEDVPRIGRFGRSAVIGPIGTVQSALQQNTAFKDLIAAPPSDEVGKQLNGILLSACLETETAAASTPSTEGKSAFTYALIKSLKSFGYSASYRAVAEETQKLLRQMGFRQTPVLKEPLAPSNMALRLFATLEQSANQGAAQQNLLSTELTAQAMGGNAVDWITLLTMIVEQSKSRSDQQSKLFGIDDAILIPAVASVVAAAIKQGQAGDQKSLVGDIIRAAGGVVKSPEQSKLFGIDDAILIPAVVSVVTAAIKQGQAGDQKSLVGDIIRAAGGVVKSPEQSKLFGIDDAILIPAVVSVVTAAIKQGQAGDQKSLIGDIIRAASTVA
ncbi:caspase family protein [Rhizobium ruizarguesonis]|uniref:caspase family protein n=1 Tax=Rhizobium ruizarguesonis TaxID=2081791 RepID=UPI00103204CE|nr:caspase family protein [Rhizobium ruizarguesonis]TBE80440.1 caspase family protein [Rhizobium ruizarguesonis]